MTGFIKKSDIPFVSVACTHTVSVCLYSSHFLSSSCFLGIHLVFITLVYLADLAYTSCVYRYLYNVQSH